jgi:hypothetical protein
MSGENSKKLRSQIVKVPDATPGLLFLNGQQRQFTLEGVWKSPVAPAANMTVDVELDSSGAITAITVVDPKEIAQQKMAEQLEALKGHGNQVLTALEPALRSLPARMGTATLAFAVAVWICWFFFPAAHLDMGGERLSLTFWHLLGVNFDNPESFLNSGSHGFFSLLGIVAIAAPFAAPFVRTAWSHYLNAAPFGYFVIAFITIVINAHRAFGELAKYGGMNPFSWSLAIVFLVASSIILAKGAFNRPSTM